MGIEELVDKIQSAIRVRSENSRSEIKDLILACEIDLRIHGVYIRDYTEPLTVQAFKLYAKANYGYDENTEKFTKCYEALRDSMALCGDYGRMVNA